MSHAQTTLDGEHIALEGDRAAAPEAADTQTLFGGIYVRENGDRVFALHRCPACGIAINPHRWPGERTVPGVAEHLRDAHDSLEDFGEAGVHDDQAKLPLAAEVLQR